MEFDEKILKILQRKWRLVVCYEKRGMSEERINNRINEYMACARMASELTGKEYDVDNDVVYVVEEV